jgi:hypothetical protein
MKYLAALLLIISLNAYAVEVSCYNEGVRIYHDYPVSVKQKPRYLLLHFHGYDDRVYAKKCIIAKQSNNVGEKQ